MKFDAFVTISGLAPAVYTVGVPQDGSSFRSVFHSVRPVFRSSAIRNDASCVSHWTMTRSS